MLKTIKTIKDKVRRILMTSEKSRDDDITLYFIYLKEHHGLVEQLGMEKANKVYNIMKKAPFPESIRRVRQKIQEDGEFIGKRRTKRLEEAERFRTEINKI